MSTIRRPTHAGSWYSDSSTELSHQLDDWLNNAELSHGPARAIIAPHAGYAYSGAVSAVAYRQISPIVVKRIFILGPSHHVRLSGCALSPLNKYQTPLYDLKVDQQVYSELYSTDRFETMSVAADEDEHSIELHLPFVAKIMEDFREQFTIVPILIGSLTPEKESFYGKILSTYLGDPQNLFIISSDFCHWGSRFRYNYYERSAGEIWQSIKKLDRTGMNLIEKLDPVMFTEYLKKYGNTICGRHPIGVLLNAVASLQAATNSPGMQLRFLDYAQSSQCRNNSDSSVSYAAASLIIE